MKSNFLLISRAVKNESSKTIVSLSFVMLICCLCFQQAAKATTPGASSITCNFNGTPINSGNYIWFNSAVCVKSCSSYPCTINFTGQNINCSSFSCSPYDVQLCITTAVTQCTTTFDGTKWITTCPPNLAGNYFLAGHPYKCSSNVPGGCSVTWSGTFSCTDPNLVLQWQCASACYNSFTTNCSTLGVKPCDANPGCSYQNTDHCGTPENYKGNCIGGGCGNGGSNCTGTCTPPCTVSCICYPSCTITSGCGGNSTCSGQGTSLCAPSGPGCNNFKWSTGATTSCININTTGTYSLTVTSQSGCSSTCSKAMTIGTTPSCTISGNTTLCGGQSTSLCAPSASGNKYSWSTGATTTCITVSTAGNYGVTVTNSSGCSSTCNQNVTVNYAPSCAITTGCGGNMTCNSSGTSLCGPSTGCDSYSWSTGATTSCINVSTTGTYSLTVTHSGCSSTCYQQITIGTPPSCTITGNNTICSGQSTSLCAPYASGNKYSWSTGATTTCITVTNAGTYSVTVTNSTGCSSTCSKAVTVNYPPSCSITTGCGGNMTCNANGTSLCGPSTGCDSYLWSTGATTTCINVNTSGTYSLTVTHSGCSSTCTQTITIGTPPSCTITGNSVICSGQTDNLCAPQGTGYSYSWSTGATTSCISVTGTGNYGVTVTNSTGCSSTCSKYVTVNKPTTGDTTARACNSFVWYGTLYTQSSTGSHVFSGGNANGCDSTVTLHLIINYSDTSTTTLTECNKYVWNDRTYTTSGSYSVLFPGSNAAGCDSTAKLILTINYSDTSKTTMTACNSYAWNNKTYTAGGTYSAFFPGGNAKGCDSTAYLCLTINYSDTSKTTMTACNSYLWNNKTYTTGGTYSKFFAGGNAVGCDSTAYLYLTINYSDTSKITETACNSYIWNNKTYTVGGTYSSFFPGGNAKGCDSTAYLCLTINYSDTSKTTQTACNSYTWNNVTYTTGGTYSKFFAGGNAQRCDSTAFLYLTINYSDTSKTTFTACNRYVWNDHTYTTGGTYSKSFPGGNAVGCDSTAILYLTINYSDTSKTTETTCNSYIWNNVTYTTGGTYSKQLPGGNAAGCDSTAILYLTINYSDTSKTTETACNSYTWNGVTYTVGGSYSHFFPAGNAVHCDSTAYLNLTINYSDTSKTSYVACNSYTWNGVTYTTSGTYSDFFPAGNAAGCDSTAYLNLTINYSDTSKTNIVSCNSYIWNGVTYSATGTYSKFFGAGNAAHCDSTAYLYLTIDTTPSVTIKAPAKTVLCGKGSDVMLCASGAYSYVWSDGETTPCITVTSIGTFSVVGTDVSGTCSSTNSARVAAGLPLNVNINIQGNTSFCQGNSVQLCASGADTYLWSPGGQTTTCITVSTGGKYYVTGTDTNPSICPALDSITLTPITPPSCNIYGSANICQGQSTNLCAPQGQGYSYSWSTGATTSCISVSSGATYSVTVTNSGGCSSMCSKCVIVSPVPNCSITSGCQGNMTCDPNGTSLCGPSGNGYSYVWSTGATTPCIQATVTGTYSLTVSNSSGCSSTCSMYIIVGTIPSCNISGNANICQGQRTTLCAPSDTGLTYSWSTGATTACITVKNANTYYLTVTNSTGCSSTCSKCVIVNPVPNCTITTGCDGNMTCNPNGTSLCGPDGCDSYAWSTGATSECIHVTVTGTYSLTVYNMYGCSSTCSQYIIISSPPSCDVTGNSPICNGQNTNLCAPQGQGYSYSWSTGATTSCINVSSAGTYSVTVSNSYGCSSSCSKCVIVNTPSNSHSKAAACNSYTWNGVTYTVGGSYSYNASPNAAGCDSTAYLNLTINYSDTSRASETACNSYTWNGVTYTVGGTYSDFFPAGNAVGCDSTAYLVLTINYSDTSYTPETACNSYVWNDVTYTTSGTYSDFFQGGNASGCDSTAYLVLTINYSDTSYTPETACNSYVWNDVTYTTSGTYSDFFPAGNAVGCDSTAYLVLTINYSDTSYTPETACNSYVWNDVTYTTSGTYSDFFQGGNAVGCDSTAFLVLTINYSDTSYTPETACNSYVWNDVTYTTSGTYSDFFPAGNAVGCDSTAYLVLTINYSDTSYTPETACNSYVWNDVTYTTSGTYSDFFQGGNASGCDSTAYLVLTINYSDTSYTPETACNSYVWNDVTYTTSGTYSDFFQGGNAVGCDSTAILNLTINYSDTTTRTVAACNYYNLPWEALATTSGEYSNTYKNVYGCDSVVNIYVTINHSSMSDTTVTACNSYTWNDVTYTVSGNYSVSFPGGNVYGCDSSAALNLTINYSDTSYTPQTACNSYTWNDVTYTTGGTYSNFFPGGNAVGCDSTAYLVLTINYSDTSYTPETACNSYVWNDVTYTTSGTYSDFFPAGNAVGCDSTAYLVLTINYSDTSYTPQTACNSYVWNDVTYTTSGTYSDFFQGGNASGCDSTAYLVLTINYSDTSYTPETACNSYVWNDVTYTTSGTYSDFFQGGNASGCDSTAYLVLTINYSDTSYTPETACNSYVWNDVTYTTSGTYSDFFPAGNAVGCDSTAYLVLTINYSDTSYTPETACNSYVWNDVTYTTSGTYSDFFPAGNAVGCDSTAYLVLTINYSDTSYTPETACNSYVWNDVTYTTSGTYSDFFPAGNAVGCDSTAYLVLTINYSDTSYTPQTACNNYVWNDVTYTTSGTYSDFFPAGNAVGCDSTAYLVLTINYSDTSYTPETACNSYNWNDQTYTTSGTYSAFFPGSNASGCDSTAYLVLTINYSDTSYTPETACNSYVWNDVTYTTSGTYSDFFPGGNASGCDSTAYLVLTINYSDTSYTPETACNSYVWNDVTYTTSGTYSDFFPGGNASGCDSTAYLVLTINYSDTSYTPETACNSYVWNDVTYTTSGTYSDFFPAGNAVGCDSTAYLVLTINYSDTSYTPETACNSYVWNDVTYTTSGTYSDFFQGGNASGCDSTAYLVLTINYSDTSYTPETACNSYVWNDVTYTTSGTYSDFFPGGNAVGCDSTAYLVLTINYSDTSYTPEIACNSYVWNDVTYTTSGTYSDFFQGGNAVGCDSTAYLVLTINYSDTSYTPETACNSYVWNDVTYTTSGTYSDFFPAGNAVGCDSTAYLVLTINYSDTSYTPETACNSYVWNDRTYTNSGTYPAFFQGGNAVGCDSTAYLVLTINYSDTSYASEKACNSYVWNDQTYTTSGTYSIPFPSGNAAGCDSTAILNLTINYSDTSYTSETACNIYGWNDRVYTTSGTYSVLYPGSNVNGCDSTAILNLTINYGDSSTTTIAACDSYIWNNVTYTIGGTYSDFFPNGNATGCDSTAILNLTINQTPKVGVNTSATTLCGAGGSIELCANGAATYLWSNGATTTCITVSTADTYTVVGTDASGMCSSDTTTRIESGIPANITIGIQGNTSFCQGTSVQLCASGADTYVWSAGGQTTTCITVSTSGKYYVTGTIGGGCSGIDSITLTTVPPPSCDISGKSNICDGECDNLCAPSGDGYTYVWSTGATTQCIMVHHSGTYSVTVSNGTGCSSTCSKCVTVSPVPNCCITSSCNNMSCDGRGTSLCGPDGCESYSWSTGAHSQCIHVYTTGMYTLTVTNMSGCSSTCCKYITVGTPPPCEITGKTQICRGECSYLCGPDGEGLSYCWSNGKHCQCINVMCSGIYYLTVTNASGCSSTCSVCVKVYDAPTSCISGNLCIMKGQCTTLCAPGCSSDHYCWSTGEHTQCITVKCAGMYCVTVTNEAGCSSSSCVCVMYGNNYVRMSGSPDIDPMNSSGNIDVNAYPNPFNTIATIAFRKTDVAGHVTVEVYTLDGAKVATLFDAEAEAGTVYKATFDATDLSEGMYIYKIITDDNVVNGKLMLVKH